VRFGFIPRLSIEYAMSRNSQKRSTFFMSSKNEQEKLLSMMWISQSNGIVSWLGAVSGKLTQTGR